MLTIRPYQAADQPSLVQLWHDCELTRPWNDPHLDIERKAVLDDGLFLVGTVETEAAKQVVASAMGGYDGHRGVVYYVAVAPAWRGHGFGRLLMTALERKLVARGCPKLNLMVRESNETAVGFYRSLGYKTEAVLALGKRLIKDD